MSFSDSRQEITRRQAIASGVAAASALALGGDAFAQGRGSIGSSGPYGPFQMALQSYSLRGFKKDGKPDVLHALAVTQELGIHFWEAFPAHFPLTDQARDIRGYKQTSQMSGVVVTGYGVVPLGKDADADRRMFDYAKAMGFQYLSVDPDPADLDKVDKLVDEYQIPVGIHNHGPGHRYDKIDKIAAVIKDHSPRIGCCIDTGHFLRSKEDPVLAVEAFGNRIYGVHLKDVKNATTFTILGQGDLRTVDFLKALAAKKYAYNLAIEYEESEDNPTADVKACLVEVKKAIAEIHPA